MKKHTEHRKRDSFSDSDTDWGQPRSRHGHGKFRRIKHLPYKRDPAAERRSWFELNDDTY